MNHFSVRRGLFTIAMVVTLYCCTADEPERYAAQPNILVLMMDDLGYNDLGINNNNRDSPSQNMNQLAADGMRFTQFYTENTCAPSRAAFMTGRYPARFGFRPVARGIPAEVTTLPEALKSLGYNTHFTGKWHLGFSVKEALPIHQGFNTSFGFLNQWLLQAPNPDGSLNRPTYRNPVLEDSSGIRKPYQGHLSDILTDHSVKLIKNNSQAEPWFIYHAFFAPHTPIQPAARYAKQFPDTPAGQYRALVKQLDDNVGKILQALKDSGQDRNTVVVLLSDNGGTNAQVNSNAPFSGTKNTYLEGGVRTPMIIHWPDKFPVGDVFNSPVTIFDLYPTLVTLAGGELTDKIDGIDLAKAIHHPEVLERTLFWEGYGRGMTTYSVLSKQRWRLYQPFLGTAVLFDLHEDPTGQKNIYDDNKALAESLYQEYVEWRNQVRRVDTTLTAHDGLGKGILTGSDFQRSPGLSGFTFAIGVTPEACDEPDIKVDSIMTEKRDESAKAHGEGIYRTIAQQQGFLYIGHSSTEGLKVEIDGQLLRGPVLANDVCHSIIVSSFFSRNISPFAPKKLKSPIALFVDGQRVEQIHSSNGLLVTEGLSNATYIGFSPDKDAEFHGYLSRPVLLNQPVFLKAGVDHAGILPVSTAVCLED